MSKQKKITDYSVDECARCKCKKCPGRLLRESINEVVATDDNADIVKTKCQVENMITALKVSQVLNIMNIILINLFRPT